MYINQTFSSDTVVRPFTGSVPVYALSMSGGVNLLSDSSLVRVVLIDTYGYHYLIFESYPLITMENTFDTLSVSDETTFLDGIICDSIRIDLISATLDLDSLKPDTNYIANATLLQSQAKWNHDSIKIAIMNQRIVEEHMYWRAGRTSIVSMSFMEKYKMLGDKYNWFGFDYYIGGIYEFLHQRVSGNPTTQVVDWFDWRYRHGATIAESPYYDGDPNETGWLTPLEDQTGCGSCWAFTASHTIADHCNLYFNAHLDFDLSETEILSCCTSISPPYTPCGNCSNGGSFQSALIWIKEENLHFEDNCQPYDPPFIFSCNGPPPVCIGEESVGIEDWNIVQIFSGVDMIKTAIITEGPLASGIEAFNHAMVLIGFNTGEIGDIIYEPEDPNEDQIILDENSSLIGQVYFVFKNSSYITISAKQPQALPIAFLIV